MKSIAKSLKSVTFLGIIFLALLAYNFTSATWESPPSAPPNENVAVPVNVGPIAQVKSGNFAANTLAATTSVWAPQYCDGNGQNCFTSSSVKGTNSDGQVTLGGIKLYQCPNIQNGSTGHTGCHTSCNGQVSSIDTCKNGVQSGGKCYYSNSICTPLYDFDAVECEVQFVARARTDQKTVVRTITQTTPQGMAAIYYWQHWDNNAPSGFGPTETLASDSWGGSYFDKSERNRVYYMNDARQSTHGTLVKNWASQSTDVAGYAEFALKTGETASLVGTAISGVSAGWTSISAEVLSCNPL